MSLNYVKQWLVVVLPWLPKMNLQMSMPLFMPPLPQMAPMPAMMPPMMPQMYFPPPPPPPMPVPPPPPMAFQIVQLQEPKKPSSVDKSEKTEKTIGIAIPMSFPAPLQFAMPPSYPGPPPISPAYCMENPRPADCPPEINPSRSQQTSYVRRGHARPRLWRDVSYEDSEFQGYSSEVAIRKIRRKKRPGLKRTLFRKNFDSDINYDDFAKPVLSYLSYDGDVKLEKRLTEDDAAELMDDKQMDQKVQILTEEDAENRQSLKIVSNVDNKLPTISESSGNHRRKQVVLRSGSLQHMLGDGKKELVFKPPFDKKISNLSVSFQIA